MLIDFCAIEICAADRAATTASVRRPIVCPVDMAAVHRYANGIVGSRDEALGDFRAGDGGAADCGAPVVCPVDKVAVDGDTSGFACFGYEVLVGFAPVDVCAPNCRTVVVRP